MEEFSKAYSVALYDLAVEEGAEEAFLEQLRVIAAALEENPAFVTLLKTPNLPISERRALLDTVFGDRIHRYLRSFLKLLTEKRQIGLLPCCYTAYRERYEEQHGILPVTAVTAVPMGAPARQRLTEILQKKTGKQIRLDNRVDPACIGGIKLLYDGKQADASVKSRLDQLQAGLKKLELKL